jgi:hypothetical protein
MAGYHRRSHKQADELTFDLFEKGRRVIVEPGRHGDDPRPADSMRFPYESRSHSTLTVDDKSFDLTGVPYGSGLEAQGADAGWYAILGANELITSQGVDHERLFLYRPGDVLVIVDNLVSKRVHDYSRWLQIGPSLHASPRAKSQVGLRGSDGFRATIWDSGGPGDRPFVLHRGESDPYRGWYVADLPGGPLRKRWAVELRSRARSATYLTTLALGRNAVEADETSPGVFRVQRAGGESIQIAVERQHEELNVEVTGD